MIDHLQKEFSVAVVTRQDLRDVGFSQSPMEQISDEGMQTIARKMSDVYCDNDYWEDVAFVTDLFLAENRIDNQTGENNAQRSESLRKDRGSRTRLRSMARC